MDPQLPPSRKMIVENLDESTLTRNGHTSRTEVLVSKPRTGFTKEYVAVADRAVPPIYSPPAPLNRQENSTSDLTGNLFDHHRSQYAMARSTPCSISGFLAATFCIIIPNQDRDAFS